MQSFQGEEVKQSHKVQSVRAVVEQTIRDLKCFKVMESNKINSGEKVEKVLDCVIALHNLKILLTNDPNFDIPSRRGVIPGSSATAGKGSGFEDPDRQTEFE
jgi:hypothetical protein